MKYYKVKYFIDVNNYYADIIIYYIKIFLTIKILITNLINHTNFLINFDL